MKRAEKTIRLFAVLVIIIFLFPVFSGCKKEKPPIKEAPKAKEYKAEKPEIKFEEGMVQETRNIKRESYVYNPRGRRDPFVPLVEITMRKVARKGILPGTLESYDVADFKLIAVLEKEGQYYGSLLAPDNKSFTVKEGTVLGLHKGKVEKITTNKLVVNEYIKDYKGELKLRQIVLELQKGR